MTTAKSTRRSMQPITGVTLEGLDEYNPAAFDAVAQPDGTFTLVPVRWMNQEEFMECAYGCGNEQDCIEESPDPMERTEAEYYRQNTM